MNGEMFMIVTFLFQLHPLLPFFRQKILQLVQPKVIMINGFFSKVPQSPFELFTAEAGQLRTPTYLVVASLSLSAKSARDDTRK